MARFEEVTEVKNSRVLYMKIIKRGGAFREHRREARIKAFREFLALIGDEEVTAKVMGQRYADFEEMVEGCVH